jgi:hypothetical protein
MYVGVTELAEKLKVSCTRVRTLLRQGRITGAFKIGKTWVIPLVEGMPQATKGSRGPTLSWKTRRINAVTNIHVNQHIIRSNNKTGDRNPVITVKRHDSNTYGHEVVINGPCRIVYEPDTGLPACNSAKVWIETFSQVEVICKEFCDMVGGKSVFCGVG